jgi:hypothetical protein
MTDDEKVLSKKFDDKLKAVKDGFGSTQKPSLPAS